MKKLELVPVGDWVIIEKIDIQDIQTKKLKRSNIVVVGGAAPKNIVDIEKQRAEALMTYSDAEKKFLEKWEEHPNQAVIVAVGEGKRTDKGLVPVEVKVGDKIMYRGNTGEPLIVDSKLYWVIKEYDIFAVTGKVDL